MGRFKLHNYGRNLHFPYTPEGGKEMEIFLYRNRTEETDDEELAAICEKFPNVGVVDTGQDLTKLSKTELVEAAKKVGVLNARHKNKVELQQLITSGVV